MSVSIDVNSNLKLMCIILKHSFSNFSSFSAFSSGLTNPRGNIYCSVVTFLSSGDVCQVYTAQRQITVLFTLHDYLGQGCQTGGNIGTE